MRIADRNWMDVEAFLKRDDRIVLPLGSTEQHAYLSLATDALLAERVAVEAAEPLGLPVLPVLAYGVTPRFLAYPGSVSLRLETYLRVLQDILDSLAFQGFRRIVVVNGHGGNTPARSACSELLKDRPGLAIRWHDWWNAPGTWKQVTALDPVASHASWMENFPWTRLAHAVLPEAPKAPAPFEALQELDPRRFREHLGDGSFGGAYQRPDADMQALWTTAVAETRAVLDEGWA